jgi:Tfp pilus assembly protein PilP
MKTVLYVLVIFLICLSGGCKKEQAPGKKPTTEKVQPAPTSEDKKVSQEVKVESETYQYDAKGKRDPFLSLVAKERQKPVKKKGASPFESVEIDEMELLAIAWDKNKSYALIILPDKKSYTITEGMTLGLQGGKVQKITKDAVHIREFVKDYRGDIKPRDVILKLHKGEE